MNFKLSKSEKAFALRSCFLDIILWNSKSQACMNFEARSVANFGTRCIVQLGYIATCISRKLLTIDGELLDPDDRINWRITPRRENTHLYFTINDGTKLKKSTKTHTHTFTHSNVRKSVKMYRIIRMHPDLIRLQFRNFSTRPQTRTPVHLATTSISGIFRNLKRGKVHFRCIFSEVLILSR